MGADTGARVRFATPDGGQSRAPLPPQTLAATGLRRRDPRHHGKKRWARVWRKSGRGTRRRDAEVARLLATSREPLAIDGERVYRIPALHVPDEGLETAQVLGAYDAVRLFADRAALHQQRFTLDDQNAVVVARICRRVDGLPLGIELAAARLAVLPLVEIDRRLDQRLALLSGGSRFVVRPDRAGTNCRAPGSPRWQPRRSGVRAPSAPRKHFDPFRSRQYRESTRRRAMTARQVRTTRNQRSAALAAK